MSTRCEKPMARWMELQAELRQLRANPSDYDRDYAEARMLGEKDGIETLLKTDAEHEGDH